MSSLRTRLLLSTLAASALSAAPAFADAVISPPLPATALPASTPSATDAATDTADEVPVAETDALLITARRQSERSIDVPVAVSALSGEKLEGTGAYTLADVQNAAPSMVAFNSNPRNSSVGIRGIGVSSASDGLDTSVGFYVDGVYLGRPGMALADLIDVERVEVLRGPQGTLFGRNTSAGVINIVTRAPSFDQQAVVEASYGNYNYNQVRLSLTGPLIDGVLAARLTAFNTHRDGVLENIKTGASANSIGRSGARLQFLWTPSPNVSLRLSGEYSIEDDTCCVSVLKQVLPSSIGTTTARTLTTFGLLGYTPTASLDYTQNNAPQNMLTDQHALSAELNWDLGWADFTSISAYRYWHFSPLQDSDGTPLDIIQVNVAQTKDNQYSQEFRLASKPGRFNWQAGVYVFRQELTDHYILNQFGYDAGNFYTTYLRTENPAAAAVVIAPGSQYIGDTTSNSDSIAVFGQGNFDITDRLTLTAGVRYTHDKRLGITDTSTVGTPYASTSIPFHYNVQVSGGNWSYLGTLTYKLTPDAIAYVTYSTGYKAAGLNLNAAVTAGSPLIVEPEEVASTEVGLKGLFFERRLTFALSAFSTRLTGLQANISPSSGARSYLANVGDIRTQGVELEADLKVTANFTVGFTSSYNDARYISYTSAPCPVGVAAPCDLTGKPVFQAPKYTANFQARYDFEGNETWRPYVQGVVTYRSGVYGTVDDSPYAYISGYTLVNLRAGASFDDGKYDLSIWLNNAGDKQYFNTLGTASIVGAAVYGISGQLGPPRTFGATLRATF
ncbi:MAG: TonB-dependent receptor [Caulobacteraceae bacterium]